MFYSFNLNLYKSQPTAVNIPTLLYFAQTNDKMQKHGQLPLKFPVNKNIKQIKNEFKNQSFTAHRSAGC